MVVIVAIIVAHSSIPYYPKVRVFKGLSLGLTVELVKECRASVKRGPHSSRMSAGSRVHFVREVLSTLLYSCCRNGMGEGPISI